MEIELPQPVDIPLDSIDAEDNTFRTSRHTQKEALVKSVSMSGILEPPLLLRNNLKYTIVLGHNRIDAAEVCALPVVPARVIDELTFKMFIEGVAKKVYHNELGPCGKCRVLNIARIMFDANIQQLRYAGKILNVPGIFVRNPEHAEKVTGLPGGLQDYLDLKNAGFRVITGVTALPSHAVHFLSELVTDTQMRFNYFREIVFMMDDILRRDGSLDNVLAVKMDDSPDRRVREESLYRAVRNIRYPLFTEMKDTIEEIAEVLRQKGITVNFPPYFEGDSCTVSFVVRKGDDLSRLSLQPDDEVVKLLNKMLDLL
jgi:hypothetical protein